MENVGKSLREAGKEAAGSHHLVARNVLRAWGVPKKEASDIAGDHPIASFARLVVKGRLTTNEKGVYLRQEVEEALARQLQALETNKRLDITKLTESVTKRFPAKNLDGKPAGDLFRAVAPMITDHMVFALTKYSLQRASLI